MEISSQVYIFQMQVLFIPPGDSVFQTLYGMICNDFDFQTNWSCKAHGRTGNLFHLTRACKFEHLLQKDVEENICTLLGHPNKCPHGSPIPGGNCCRHRHRRPRTLVIPLSECDVDTKGTIAFIRTQKESVMNKLTAMGVLPGTSIHLLAKTPAYLFQMGETQFAVDKELAEEIQVRIA